MALSSVLHLLCIYHLIGLQKYRRSNLIVIINYFLHSFFTSSQLKHNYSIEIVVYTYKGILVNNQK